MELGWDGGASGAGDSACLKSAYSLSLCALESKSLGRLLALVAARRYLSSSAASTSLSVECDILNQAAACHFSVSSYLKPFCAKLNC
eukprot:3736517-Pleurochrysis_carterae.AAC.1